jgi:RNA polymerase sigma-70 factor (ECF subfamily)
MSDLESHIDLVRKAQQGGKDATGRLAEVASVRLREYVLRLTLDKDLTEDIVQESMLEMLRVFDKLKKAERFWSWLYGIAYNKVRTHRRGQSRHKATLLSVAEGSTAGEGKRDVLAETVGGELKRIVLKAMAELKPRQRDVLTMRCYDRMAYAEIAEVMGCSKFGAQALFYRAKKSLAKRLSQHGLGKGYLLAALVLFGKVTASSEAAAANISVTAATLKVGAAASLAAVATSKTTVVTLAAGALITAGSVGVGPSIVESYSGHSAAGANSPLTVSGQAGDVVAVEESWYFYPDGPDGPVMMRVAESNGGREGSRFRILQNQHGNYRYDKGTIHIDKAHLYNADLSVVRLPTDDKALSAFISQIEGRPADMEGVSASGDGLLVICKRSGEQNSRAWRVAHHSNVMEEVFFQFNRPGNTKIVDNRDAMHKRGWTYFRVTGQMNGEEISGVGRIPFIYAQINERHPWVDLRIGNRLRIIDSGREVGIYDASGKVIESYAGGSFFDYLGSPWMGLHTIDSVRRAMAEKRIWFETKQGQKRGKAKVALACGNVKLVYEIDLGRDVVETVKVLGDGGAQSNVQAVMHFSYLDEIPSAAGEFTVPRPRASTKLLRERLGVLWLARLSEEAQ